MFFQKEGGAKQPKFFSGQTLSFCFLTLLDWLDAAPTICGVRVGKIFQPQKKSSCDCSTVVFRSGKSSETLTICKKASR
jgi:hypothetical protein